MDSFEYKKSLGQNFLRDNNIIDKIVDSSNIDKNTLVIEIGPGDGALSKRIVPLCGHAILYEIDTRLKDKLNELLANYNNYEIIFGDFLKQDITLISKNYEKVYVIANLPYYITTAIITKLMKELIPDKMIVMMQDEVADRISAMPGNREYGMISVLINSMYDVDKMFKVSRNSFVPVPNVDSAVVKLEKNDKLCGVPFLKFEEFIMDAFQFKRKNLRNNLKKYDLNLIQEILSKNNYSLSDRAEDIPVNVFIEIVRNI